MTVWTSDTAHQPNLNYVPYIMTGTRWHLDRLNAQAAFAISSDWPGYRCPPYGSGCTGLRDIVLNGYDQVRAQAWSIREIQEAAFVGRPGSFELGYYTQVVANNWSYLNGQQSGTGFMSAAVQGQAAGWVPSDIGTPNYQNSPWMQDYFTGIAVLAAGMGDAGARQFVNWQKDTWLAGRFLHIEPHDGAAYRLITTDTAGAPLKTWSGIENATAEKGFSPKGGWVNADYAAPARAALGGVLSLYPDDLQVRQSLTWINNAGAPFTDVLSMQNDPTFNVVPLR